MTQAERDRLVALKKAKKKLITQKQAAEEIGVTERQCVDSCANCEGRGTGRLSMNCAAGHRTGSCQNKCSSGPPSFSPIRCTGDSDRRWRPNTWRRNTRSW